MRISRTVNPLFPLHPFLSDTKGEEETEEDDEESYPVDDYDYRDYETAIITSDTELIAGGSLPIFLAEPVDTFVVKGKPATLHCRAAHALQVRITYFKACQPNTISFERTSLNSRSRATLTFARHDVFLKIINYSGLSNDPRK